jgi:hypothetical protein
LRGLFVLPLKLSMLRAEAQLKIEKAVQNRTALSGWVVFN